MLCHSYLVQPNASDALVFVASRFIVEDHSAFAEQSREALAALSACDGYCGGRIGASTDDARLRIIETSWASIGAYRRALSKYDVKLSAIPFLSTAIDEPSAYEVVHINDADGERDFASGLAFDAGDVSLGNAAAPSVPPVHT